jgi:hypothetical protein
MAKEREFKSLGNGVLSYREIVSTGSKEKGDYREGEFEFFTFVKKEVDINLPPHTRKDLPDEEEAVDLFLSAIHTVQRNKHARVLSGKLSAADRATAAAEERSIRALIVPPSKLDFRVAFMAIKQREPEQTDYEYYSQPQPAA